MKDYKSGNFLETSPDRSLCDVICTSIKSILKRPAALAKDVSETTNKVRIRGPEDVSSCWQRMLQTIDGLGEAEVATVCTLIPRFGRI